MGYENSKIYKLQHTDGHFYIGSTYAELRERLRGHKTRAKEYPERKVYAHIAGDWSKVRILLIEEFSCENKDQLRRKEDEYIQKELNNPLCLNVLHAVLNVEKRKAKEREYKQEYRAEHLDEIRERDKAYYEENREEIREKQAEYYVENAETIKEQAREYRAEHREECKARDRAYYEAHKDEFAEYARANAERINARRREKWQEKKDRVNAERRAKRAEAKE
jgi:hypothetical protein